MSLPTWIKTEIYNDVINLQEKLNVHNQEGIIVISKEKAYFQRENDEMVEVLLQRENNTKSRIIAEDLTKYKEDLIRFEINPPEEINIPYDETDENFMKILKLFQLLQQRRVARDRIKSLFYYYLFGKLIDDSSQQYLYQLQLNNNQMKKLKLKSGRTYQLFKIVGQGQIYNTRYLSVSILAEMGKDQYEEILHSLTVSQEFNT